MLASNSAVVYRASTAKEVEEVVLVVTVAFIFAGLVAEVFLPTLELPTLVVLGLLTDKLFRNCPQS